MPVHGQRIRIDQLLTERGLAPSRSRARDMVARGCVRVSGKPINKAGALVDADAEIAVSDAAQAYVSRAALKLIAGLDASGFDVAGKHTVDLGASTGGFTQVLLERDVASVTAIDVGHGQMVQSLRDNPKVDVREGMNARDLTGEDFARPPQVIVSDVSFISLMLAAEPTLRLAAPGALAVLLVKPQFEVGRDGIGKGGLVSDPQLVEEVLARISAWFGALPGWRLLQLLPSPISGGDGNREYLLCGVRDGQD